MPNAPDLTGIALDGRYELHELIGEGEFGRVYRGRDRRLARRVAVKVIKPWWADDPEWAHSFEREAQVLASLSDPGIVQIYDVGSAPEGPYYVAELVDGESLASKLRRGRVPVGEACDITQQVALALARAHDEHIVHRDVKPANVLIASDGRVKVADFGVARLTEGASDAGAGTIAGTPWYMAPEQAMGNATTPATDVYSIGVILYEMLAGRPPFGGESAYELAFAHVQDPPPPLGAGIPPLLVEVVDRALSKEPRERYAEGAELAAALQRARGSLGAEALPAEATNAGGPGAVAVLTPPATATVVRPPREAARTPVKQHRSARRNFNPGKRRRRVAILGGLLALALGVVAAAVALTQGHVRIPDLRGMTRRAVIAQAGRLHLRTAFRAGYSEAPRDTAMGQNPAPGARVSEGASVRVVLSAGPRPVTLPKVLGASLADAGAVLGALRLRPAVSYAAAPGVAPGTVTNESPSAGASMQPGSVVRLSVAEIPRLRYLTSFSGDGNGTSGPFRIRGTRWHLDYSMGYDGTCALIFICSGPTVQVTDARSGATVDSFDLGEGDRRTRIVGAGPGVFNIQIVPGSDSARWKVTVEDYY